MRRYGMYVGGHMYARSCSYRHAHARTLKINKITNKFVIMQIFVQFFAKTVGKMPFLCKMAIFEGWNDQKVKFFWRWMMLFE